MRRVLQRFALHRAVAILAVAVVPSVAHADLYLGRSGESVAAVERTVLIVQNGRRETLVETQEITSTAPRFVWLRAFPAPAEVGVAPEGLLTELRKETVVQEPYNEKVRRNLFGPSVVTVLTRRFGWAKQFPPPEDPYRGELRQLELGPAEFFTGRVTSSTITGELILPESLAEFFRRYEIHVDESNKRELSRYLNREWLVMGALVYDNAPSDQTRARLGPVRMDFEADEPVFSQLTLDRPFIRYPETTFFMVGSGPLVPATLRTVWDAQPWEHRPRQRGEFVATYSHGIDPAGPIAYEVTEQASIPLPSDPFLVRSHYERGNEALVDLSFIMAKDAVVIPGNDRRKSGSDIFLCILLGLTPLIYTPESWFLLWLAARAKDRARREGRAFGTRLWSLYAIAVAVFWFVIMDDVGRLAALAPMIIGIGQLAIPYTEREPPQVRVQFKRKKA